MPTSPKNGGQKVDIEREPIVSLVPTALLVLMIIGLAISSFFHTGISIWSGLTVMILGAAGLLWYRFVRKESTADTLKMIKGLDWETIVFLIGIFIVIGAIAETGLLEEFAIFLSTLVGSNVLLGFVVILAVSVVISGFVDNVPYIIAMLPVASTLAVNMGPNRTLAPSAHRPCLAEPHALRSLREHRRHGILKNGRPQLLRLVKIAPSPLTTAARHSLARVV